MMKIIRIISITLIIALTHCFCTTKKSGDSEAVNSPKKQQPNLVFIFSDQQSFDMLGCNGNDQIITPHIDQLAEQGLRFTHCFSNEPICTPFRGMLMSGQYPLQNGCFHNDFPLVPGHGKKFAEVLRDGGYNTAYIGKWHLLGGNRRRPIPPGQLRYGFDEVFLSNNCHVDFRPGKCFYWNEEGEQVFFDKWEVYGQTDQTLEYLDTRKNSDKPFALFVSWHPPHDWGKFKGEDGVMHYRYDAPEELMKLYNRDSIKVRPGMERTPDLLRMYHGQMAMTSGVDKAFGQIMDKLKEIGEYENSLIVFTSDHGDMLEFENAPFPKHYPHDYSLHIPYIMRLPGKIPENKSTSLLFGALDMMPTILGLLDLEVPNECHGKNLSEAIVSENEEAVDYVPIFLISEVNAYRGVITKEFTYAFEKDGTDLLHNKLYDRINDPFQLNNLIENPDYSEIRAGLEKITYEWMNQFDDKFYTMVDFKKAKTKEQWQAAPYERPIDVMKRYEESNTNTSN